MNLTYIARALIESIVYLGDHDDLYTGKDSLNELLFDIEHDESVSEDIIGVVEGCLEDIDLLEPIHNEQPPVLTPYEEEIVSGVVSKLKILLQDIGITVED